MIKFHCGYCSLENEQAKTPSCQIDFDATLIRAHNRQNFMATGTKNADGSALDFAAQPWAAAPAVPALPSL
jgi:hypothetical protein